MDTKKKELDFDFQSWIKEQHNDEYQIVEDNESLIIYLRISFQWRYNYLFNSRWRRLHFTVGLLRIYSYCE